MIQKKGQKSKMCEHKETELDYKVFRLHDEGLADSWRLDLRLKCKLCQKYFDFKTNKKGVLSNEPTTGLDTSKISIPLIAPDTGNDSQ